MSKTPNSDAVQCDNTSSDLNANAYQDEKQIFDGSETPELKIEDVTPDYGRPFWKVPHLLKLSLHIFILSLASTNNGYDGSLLNGLYAMPDFMNAIGNPSGATLGVISNGMPFGLVFAFFLAPYVIDKYGRKSGIYIGNVLICIGVLIQSCSCLLYTSRCV